MKYYGTILTILLAGLYAGNAFAQQNMHTGVPAGQHVNLLWQNDFGSACGEDRSFFRRTAAGGVAAEPFVVPDGKQLIITDIIWQGDPTPNPSFITNRPPRFLLSAITANGVRRTLFEGTPLLLSADTGNNVGGRERIFSGIRVATKRGLCADVAGIGINGGTTGATNHRAVKAELYGYLIDT